MSITFKLTFVIERILIGDKGERQLLKYFGNIIKVMKGDEMNDILSPILPFSRRFGYR
jgi:hypothetical protein